LKAKKKKVHLPRAFRLNDVEIRIVFVLFGNLPGRDRKLLDIGGDLNMAPEETKEILAGLVKKKVLENDFEDHYGLLSRVGRVRAYHLA